MRISHATYRWSTGQPKVTPMTGLENDLSVRQAEDRSCAQMS